MDYININFSNFASSALVFFCIDLIDNEYSSWGYIPLWTAM